jgi:FkbM family methyltransferase
MPSLSGTFKNTFRRTRRAFNQALGRDVRVAAQLHCRKEFLGSEYGGWSICPDAISRQSVVYSFGIGQDISWDLAMIDRFGVQIHAFDPTPKSIEWIRKQKLPPEFHVHEFGLADYDGIARFMLPRPDYVSFSMTDSAEGAGVATIEAPVHRLDTILSMFGHKKIDVLKMDIEGAEIGVIATLGEAGVEIDQLLVEFHHTVGNAREVEQTSRAIATLNGLGFKLFFNTAVGKEFSFKRV